MDFKENFGLKSLKLLRVTTKIPDDIFKYKTIIKYYYCSLKSFIKSICNKQNTLQFATLCSDEFLVSRDQTDIKIALTSN